jgi:polyhydroxybutyrate depolymerase
MSKRRIFFCRVVAAILFCAAWAGHVSSAPGTSKSLKMEFAGRLRRYVLHVPTHDDPAKPAALVMVLHGATQSAESAEHMSHMSELADQHGFIAVYPSGTGPNSRDRVPTWNAGNCCAYAMNNHVDDVGYLGALIRRLEHDYNIDAKRVYVTGISNGAMLSYRAACELSGQIAAIAPVEGALSVDCKPAERVSVIVFHGTADHLVPFRGGTTPFQVGSRRSDNSVAGAISFWVKRDDCSPTPRHEETAEVHADFYSGCKDDTAVALYAIQGGHHMWPGLAISGNHVHASEVMWDFFTAHPKP